MGAREDGEMFGMMTMSASSPGAQGVAIILAWTLAMFKILDGLHLKPLQYRLAVDVLERWGMALPWTAAPPDEPRLFVGDEVAGLRKLFEDTWHTATLVRIFRPLVQMETSDVNRDLTEAVVAELRAFCDEKAKWLDGIRLDEATAVTCELHVFRDLVEHCARLMEAILGASHWTAFRIAYDETIAGLQTIRDLKQAPPQ